jgi:hypothetical protein
MVLVQYLPLMRGVGPVGLCDFPSLRLHAMQAVP